MKTDDLIHALAADEVLRRPRLAARLALGVAVSLAALALLWTLRPDLAQALRDPLVAAKFALPLGVAGLAAVLARRGGGLWALALPVALAAALWGATLPGTGIWAAIRGDSLWVCLASIPALALPLGVALFQALRLAVIPDPRRAGLLAGLAAGGLAAAIYALHCDEDAPSFYVLWYGAGIALSGAIGRVLGPRWLGV